MKWNVSQRPKTVYDDMQDSFKTFQKEDLAALERNNLLRNINLKSLAKKSKLKIKIDPEKSLRKK